MLQKLFIIFHILTAQKQILCYGYVKWMWLFTLKETVIRRYSGTGIRQLDQKQDWMSPKEHD